MIENTKKNNKKKVDINNADSGDVFENKVTSKVSKKGKKYKLQKNITSNELAKCSKNEMLMKSFHKFLLEYKGNYQNETVIKQLPKKMTF